MITHIFETGYTNHIDMDVHPNGKSAYLIINKKDKLKDQDAYNIKVVEIDLASRKVIRIIKTYTQFIDAPGPFGYCAIRCLPNGSLLIGLSISLANKDVVAAFDILSNTIPIFNPTSTNTTLPAEIIDNYARQLAEKASSQAKTSVDNITAVANKITALDSTITQWTKLTNARIDTLPTKDYIWQNIVDRVAAEVQKLDSTETSVFESPIFKGYVQALAQDTLLTAIEYAKTSPTKSALYNLMKSVYSEK